MTFECYVWIALVALTGAIFCQGRQIDIIRRKVGG